MNYGGFLSYFRIINLKIFIFLFFSYDQADTIRDKAIKVISKLQNTKILKVF